jgi:hypothetical protein
VVGTVASDMHPAAHQVANLVCSEGASLTDPTGEYEKSRLKTPTLEFRGGNRQVRGVAVIKRDQYRSAVWMGGYSIEDTAKLVRADPVTGLPRRQFTFGSADAVEIDDVKAAHMYDASDIRRRQRLRSESLQRSRREHISISHDACAIGQVASDARAPRAGWLGIPTRGLLAAAPTR